MMQHVRHVIVVASLVIPSIVHAQGFGIAPHIGTMGVGVDGAIALSQGVSLRVGANYFPGSLSVSASDVDFTLDFATPQFLATFDLHPGGGIFRLSIGALTAAGDLSLAGDLTEPVEIGAASYTPAQIGTLTGTMLTNSVSPYVGIGLGNVARRGVGFFLDLGVAFHGTPGFALEADGPLSSDPTFRANLETERRDIEVDLEPYVVYPVLSLGLKVGF